MAATPEGKVKDAIKKYLTKHGAWFAGKPVPPVVVGWFYMPVPTGFGVNGIPDFCGIWKGKPFYIEAKAPGCVGDTTDNQKNRHAEIEKAGGIVLVVSSVEELETGMKTVDW